MFPTEDDPTITDESFDVGCSVVGCCDPDDALVLLLGSDGLRVVVVAGSEQRASKDSIMVGNTAVYKVNKQTYACHFLINNSYNTDGKLQRTCL